MCAARAHAGAGNRLAGDNGLYPPSPAARRTHRGRRTGTRADQISSRSEASLFVPALPDITEVEGEVEGSSLREVEWEKTFSVNLPSLGKSVLFVSFWF